mmetsp:Transcript_18740/g.46543  ORF Transcript_18740/g.46543 Transcript_18740/m.46543 type:complete len:228 (+) Transcript_18740:311-994(+)
MNHLIPCVEIIQSSSWRIPPLFGMWIPARFQVDHDTGKVVTRSTRFRVIAQVPCGPLEPVRINLELALLHDTRTGNHHVGGLLVVHYVPDTVAAQYQKPIVLANVILAHLGFGRHIRFQRGVSDASRYRQQSLDAPSAPVYHAATQFADSSCLVGHARLVVSAQTDYGSVPSDDNGPRVSRIGTDDASSSHKRRGTGRRPIWLSRRHKVLVNGRKGILHGVAHIKGI